MAKGALGAVDSVPGAMAKGKIIGATGGAAYGAQFTLFRQALAAELRRIIGEPAEVYHADVAMHRAA